MTIELEFEENTMSRRYISCKGHNLSFSSSGVRLTTSIITSLLDDDYEVFLIDEPELGISPEAQIKLANFLFNKNYKSKYFPHVKSIIFATHSSLFLDKFTLTNNYEIEKKEDTINITQAKTLSDLNRIYFYLLGNRFENLFLPSVIVFTEGPSDELFITKVLELSFPDQIISVINSNSDGKMKEILHWMSIIFKDIQKSPYRSRIIPIFDKIHDKTAVDNFVKKGIPKENIIIWEKNGIEYYYPKEIISELCGGFDDLIIDGDKIKINELNYTKIQLANNVVNKIDVNTQYCCEFKKKLIDKLKKLIT